VPRSPRGNGWLPQGHRVGCRYRCRGGQPEPGSAQPRRRGSYVTGHQDGPMQGEGRGPRTPRSAKWKPGPVPAGPHPPRCCAYRVASDASRQAGASAHGTGKRVRRRLSVRRTGGGLSSPPLSTVLTNSSAVLIVSLKSRVRREVPSTIRFCHHDRPWPDRRSTGPRCGTVVTSGLSPARVTGPRRRCRSSAP